jgi:hypothetical protein
MIDFQTAENIINIIVEENIKNETVS